MAAFRLATLILVAILLGSCNPAASGAEVSDDLKKQLAAAKELT